MQRVRKLQKVTKSCMLMHPGIQVQAEINPNPTQNQAKSSQNQAKSSQTRSKPNQAEAKIQSKSSQIKPKPEEARNSYDLTKLLLGN